MRKPHRLHSIPCMPLDPAAQCRFLLATYAKLVADLDDGHRVVEPRPGSKTAGWIVGHLCVTGDFGRRLCGQKAICPAEWRAKFNPGTQPSANAADYPPMRALIEHFHKVYGDLPIAYGSASAETLGAPNPYEPGRASFPTGGDFAAYLMTGHLGYHLGQLYGWRAGMKL
jgi:hypothetical protein